MNVSAIIQARMSSRRLPGKVMRQVNGKPMLQYLLDRLKKSKRISKIIMATSTDRSDQEIFDYCQKNQIECFRGPLENVAKRYKEAIEHYGVDGFIRICGDSPLIDADLIDGGIERFLKGEHDIITNLLKHTFPSGQNFEILKSDVFIKSYSDFKEEDDFEHVTLYFYKNAPKFRIYNIVADDNYSDINLCVDTLEDFDVFTNILQKMEKPFIDYNWQDLIEIYKSVKNN